MDWTAFEQVYGPILPHDRIDLGFAQLSYLLALAFSSGRRKPRWRTFLPPYMRDMLQRSEDGMNPDQLKVFFEGLVNADH